MLLEIDNARYMNHSKTPNTDFSDPEIGLAIKDIAVGEEITTDYGEYMEEEQMQVQYQGKDSIPSPLKTKSKKQKV